MTAESQAPTPQPTPEAATPLNQFNAKLLAELKAWPGRLTAMLQKPIENMASLPESGSWEPILIRAGIAGAVLGVTAFISLLATAFGLGVQMLIESVIIALVGVPVSAFIFNLVLGMLGKEPGLYRTATFLSLISVINMAGVAASYITPLLYYPFLAASLYLIYHYALCIAGLTKEKAAIFIGALALIGISGGWMHRIGSGWMY